ncbi:MAG: hypothetical protein CMI55_01010 [Parcubacteria group bacterium]|nr:hypothetical protein [Parcubacteria group bacterium]
MKIDFHHHIFPKAYLKELSTWTGYPRARLEPDGRIALVRKADEVLLRSSVHDNEARIKDLDKFGIDIAVLTLPNPFVDIFPIERGIPIARAVNENLAEEVKKYPDRLVGFATLPLRDPLAAVEELTRAITELGLKGVCIPASIDGQSPTSSQFIPIYETASRLDIPVFIHPNIPAGSEPMSPYRLITILGYLYDTTLMVSKLVFEGIFDRVPNLKLIISHQGAAIPYLAGRINQGYIEYKECKANINRPPMEYLKRLYTDTISFDHEAMMFAYRFFGEDQLLYGTDYPFLLGTPSTIAEDVNGLDITDEQKDKIFHKNALSILKLS